MSGIYGIISAESDAETRLAEMGSAITQDQDDSSGCYVNRELGVQVGWRSRKGGFADCLPIVNEKKDIILLFDGEEYTDMDEINALKGRNHVFDKRSASYVVHMYEEWGEGALRRLNGRFNGLLIDLRKKVTILFNDRYGAKGIYCHRGRDAFYFASEAKAIAKVNPHLRRTDRTSLAEMLALGWVLEDRTLFEGIGAMPGGSAWYLHPGEPPRKSTYCDAAELEDQPYLDEDFLCDRAEQTLKRIMQRYCRGEGKIAVSLPGSPATDIILAHQACKPDRFHLYATEAGIADARRRAAGLGGELYEYRLDDAYARSVPELTERAVCLSEGAVGIGGGTILHVHQGVRQHAPQKMSGLHGDAVLGTGVRLLTRALDESVLVPEFRELMAAARDRYGALLRAGHRSDLVASSVRRDQGLHRIEEHHFALKTPFLDNDLVALMFRQPAGRGKGGRVGERLLRKAEAALSPPVAGNGWRNLLAPGGIRGLVGRRRGYDLAAGTEGTGTHHCVPGAVSAYIRDILHEPRSWSREYIDRNGLLRALGERGGRRAGECSALVSAELFARHFTD